jgi:hypothetical protein
MTHIADALNTYSNRRHFAAELAELAEISEVIRTNSLANLPTPTTLSELDAGQRMLDAGDIARGRQLAILSQITAQMESHLASLMAPVPPPPPPVVCGKCHGPIEHPFEFRGVDYCCLQCCHDAGDRRECLRGVCGCTAFAIKRRQLREHRQKMRVLERLIVDNGLVDELEVAMEEDGCPDHDPFALNVEMDEGSDAEDPMQTQAIEMNNIDSIVKLSHNMVELAGVRRDLKRARGSDQDA